MFEPNFTYEYITARDGRVCPICESHDGKKYSGIEIKEKFPMIIHLSGTEYHPRTHDAPGFPAYIKDRDNDPNNKCGCRLYLLNAAMGFEQLLHKEKLDAM